MKSQLPLRSAATKTKAKTLDHAEIFVSSKGLDWAGLYLEGGLNEGWNADDLTVDGHYLAVNLAEVDLPMMSRTRGGWTKVVIPSNALWIHPEGLPFTLRVQGTAHWLGAVIDGDHMDALMGSHYELLQGYGVEDGVLSQLMRTLMEFARATPPVQLSVVQPVIQALMVQAVSAHGRPVATPQSAILDAAQVQEMISWVTARLGRSLTVQQMAERVGMSPSYFARLFKRATGESPWAMRQHGLD